MITLFSVLTVFSALIYIALSMQALDLYRSLAQAIKDNSAFDREIFLSEIKNNQRLALKFAVTSCLSYAITMVGHFLFSFSIQAITASLALIAAGVYASYFFEQKAEALISIETCNK